MIRLLSLTLLALAACQIEAPSAMYAGAVRSSPRLDAVDADLTGAVMGVETGDMTMIFSELRSLSDDAVGLDMFELLVGGRFATAARGVPRAGTQIDFGISTGDLDTLSNPTSLLSLGAGVFMELPLGNTVSLFAFGGGRYYFDVTDPTTCNDGTTSNSTGQGTCSHHGGIRRYNDYIGDGFAPELSFGIRVYF